MTAGGVPEGGLVDEFRRIVSEHHGYVPTDFSADCLAAVLEAAGRAGADNRPSAAAPGSDCCGGDHCAGHCGRAATPVWPQDRAADVAFGTTAPKPAGGEG